MVTQLWSATAVWWHKTKVVSAAANVLQDGGAMMYTFSVRGDGASRFCPMCKNLFVLKAAVGSEENYEDCSMMRKTIKHSELDLCADSELFQAWDRLVDRRGNVGAADSKLLA